MAITLAGTTGITTPGLTNSGNETITGTLNVGGLTPNVYPIVSGTAVASTSGTSIDFTSIPSWVKRITVILNGVSTSGTSNPQVQIGTSGGVQNTGYAGSTTQIIAGGATSVSNFSAGFTVASALASNTIYGAIVLVLVDSATGLWTSSISLGGTYAWIGGGSKTLSGTLDRVRITTVNGTDTFDAGSINLLWE